MATAAMVVVVVMMMAAAFVVVVKMMITATTTVIMVVSHEYSCEQTRHTKQIILPIRFRPNFPHVKPQGKTLKHDYINKPSQRPDPSYTCHQRDVVELCVNTFLYM